LSIAALLIRRKDRKWIRPNRPLDSNQETERAFHDAGDEG
jgi:hypothetical protein